MSKVALVTAGLNSPTLYCAPDPMLDLVLASDPAVQLVRDSVTSYRFGPDAYLPLISALESLGYWSISSGFRLPLPGDRSWTWSDVLLSEFSVDARLAVGERLLSYLERDGWNESFVSCLRASTSRSHR